VPEPIAEPTAFWINTAKNDTGNQWLVSYRLALGQSVKDANGNVYSIASYSNLSNSYVGWTQIDSTGNLVGGFPLYAAPNNAFNPSSSGNGTSVGGDIARDSNGNIFIASKFAQDTSLLKLNSSGNIVYAKRYVNGNTDVPFAVKLDSAQENIYITSDTRTPNNIQQFSLFKISASTGNIIWQKSANVPGQTTNSQGIARGIDIDAQGNIYVCGQTRIPSRGTLQNFYLTKMTTEANVIWQKYYTANVSSFSESAFNLAINPTTGNIALGGIRNSGFQSLLIDQHTGNIIWNTAEVGGFSSPRRPAWDNQGNVWFPCLGATIFKLNGATGNVELQRYLQYEYYNQLNANQQGTGEMAYSGLLHNNDYSGFTVMGGSINAVGNLLIARLPSNGAGTGTYLGAASFGTPNSGNLQYLVPSNTFTAGNLVAFDANHVWYNRDLTTQDISNVGRQTGNLAFYSANVLANLMPNVLLEYIVVGGGGGGGYDAAGGGGGGGVLIGSVRATSLAGYPITVGAGGAGRNTAPGNGVSGNSSSAFGLTAAGGGGGGSQDTNGTAGASGGGAGAGSGYLSRTISLGNTPPTSPSQGNDGALSSRYGGGGGGGANAAGSAGSGGPIGSDNGGNGGAGYIWLDAVMYGAGGGGGSSSGARGIGGGTPTSGAGNGGNSAPGSNGAATAATPGRGGGGGGAGGTGASPNAGTAGGPGTVIVRYAGATNATGGNISNSGGYTYHTFTTPGTFTLTSLPS
jgi:hypothetical protein